HVLHGALTRADGRQDVNRREVGREPQLAGRGGRRSGWRGLSAGFGRGGRLLVWRRDGGRAGRGGCRRAPARGPRVVPAPPPLPSAAAAPELAAGAVAVPLAHALRTASRSAFDSPCRAAPIVLPARSP